MGYVARRGDPKFSSIQSFRTADGIYVRIVTRVSHGWDPIVNISYKNEVLKEHERSLDITTQVDLRVFLFSFDSSAASVLNRTTFNATHYSNAIVDLTGHLDVTEMDLGFNELVFEDRLGDGNSDNLYNFNSTIYHSSSTLKNALRTFIYPTKTAGPTTLAPSNAQGQYYISSSSTAIYIANSELQNSYYRSISLQSTDQDMYGYFVGGTSPQTMYFECSMGAKSAGVNTIKGYIHIINPTKVESTSTTYSVCTNRNSSNYYRDSPYPACDGTNLTSDIINDASNVFIEGGCCGVTASSTAFNVRHTVEAPTSSSPTGGSILYNWGGGTPPYRVILGCVDGDTACAAAISGINASLVNTTDTSYTLEGLSGTTIMGDTYGYGISDSDNNVLGGDVFVMSGVSTRIVGRCDHDDALNYSAGRGGIYDIINNDICAWCSALTGGITIGAATSTNVDDDFDNAFEVTIEEYEKPLANGTTTITISVEPHTYIGNHDLYFSGTGDEYLIVTLRQIMESDIYYGDSYLEQFGYGAAGSANDTTIMASSSTVTEFVFDDIPPGYYVVRARYSDSVDDNMFDNCAMYSPLTVYAVGCTDTAAGAVLSGGVPWITNYAGASSYSPTYTFMENVPAMCSIPDNYSATAEALFSLTVAFITDGNNVCSFGANLQYDGNDFNYNFILTGVIQSVANSLEVSANAISLTGIHQTTSIITIADGSALTIDSEASNSNAVGEYNIDFGTTAGTVQTEVGVSTSNLAISLAYNSVELSATINLTWPPTLVSLATIENEELVDATGLTTLCEGCFDSGDYAVGCTDITACNYDQYATIDNGSCFPMDEVETYNSPTDVTINTEIGTLTGNPCGCYSPDLQYSDEVAVYTVSQWNDGIPYGSAVACGQAVVFGCMDTSYMEYDPSANEHVPADCITVVSVDCMESTACNYNPSTSIQACDDCCIYTAEGCDSMQNWVIDTFNPPNTCNETETADGVVSITNSSFYGHFYFGVIGNGVLYTSGGIVLYEVSGVGYNGISHLNVEAGSNSFTTSGGISVSQSAALGTTIVLSGLAVGSLYFGASSSFSAGSLGAVINGSTLCACNSNALDTSTFDNLDNPVLPHKFEITALGGTRANGSAGSCGCMDPLADTYDSTATVHTPSTCNYYGCTDPLASNYLPGANIECTEPSSQTHGGYPCSPCVYGMPNNLYSPAFCMPSNVTQQLEIIRKCIGTAGTNSYINTITGRDNCTFKEAWKLILIEYLLSKKGLDCVYNCSDGATPKLGDLKSCAEQVTNPTVFVGNLASNISTDSSEDSNSFNLGSVVQIKATSDSKINYYKLDRMPPDLGTSNVLIINHPDFYSNAGAENLAILYSPLSSIGHNYWKICEEPPSKPSNKDYIGKFITFVQNYCRACQLPSSKVISIEEPAPIESVITVNGIILTVNNSELK